MKRVLHVIDTGGPGGAETVFFDLIRTLDPKRFRSIAAVPDEGWIYQKLRSIGVPVFVVPSFGSFSIPYLRSLSRLVREHGIDLVHAHLLGPSIYASVAGALSGVPVVSTLHGSVDGDAHHAHRGTKFRILSGGAARVVLVSEPLRELFVSKSPLPRSKTAVIENGIDLNQFVPGRNSGLRESLGFDDTHFLVGAVGNIRRAKRYDVFLEAAARMLQLSPAYRFVVFGHWHGELDPALVKLRRELGLEEHVVFAGFTADVATAMNGLDAFLLTSESEGFSLATIQALACGLPVVATRCGGPESIVENGVTGILVDVEADDQIADAVDRIRRSPQLAADMGVAGRKQVEKRFSIEAQVASYEHLYDEIIAAGRFPRVPGARWVSRKLAGSTLNP